jgi:hypothetical protein
MTQHIASSAAEYTATSCVRGPLSPEKKEDPEQPEIGSLQYEECDDGIIISYMHQI